MKTRPQDIVWAVLAAVVVFLSFVGLLTIFRSDSDALLTLLGVIPAGWIALGCWRRTKWGAPEGGLREDQERRATGRDTA